MLSHDKSHFKYTASNVASADTMRGAGTLGRDLKVSITLEDAAPKPFSLTDLTVYQ